MPVTTEHKQYSANKKRWAMCRDAVAGEDQIKAKRTEYLPRLSGQDKKEYNGYLSRSSWYNASGRTKDGLTGLVFRKKPSVTVPDGMKPFLEDISYTGVTVFEFSENVINEAVNIGRGGILVEHPVVEKGPDDIITVADAEAKGLRPYMTFYKAEDIVNWKTGRVKNKTVLVQVVLREIESKIDDDDEFKIIESFIYRVLELKEEKYQQRIFRKKNETAEYEQDGPEIIPKRSGNPIDHIPFKFTGVQNATPNVEKPPILDLVFMNFSHYRTTADLENGAHWTGVPTPVFIGLDENTKEIKLGSTEGIVISNPEGDAKFLEFTGQGLEALEKRLEKKEQMMAVLGARILAQEKKMVEAAETARIHKAGESSVLASIANTASEAIQWALQEIADWSGNSGDCVFELNTDYLPDKMDPQMLIALMQTWQSGGLTDIELFEALKKGEIIRGDKTYDAHEDEIRTQGPASGKIGVDDEDE